MKRPQYLLTYAVKQNRYLNGEEEGKLRSDLLYLNCNPKSQLYLSADIKAEADAAVRAQPVKVKLKIATERELLFDENSNMWLWHKTWNLPVISVRLVVSGHCLPNFGL